MFIFYRKRSKHNIMIAPYSIFKRSLPEFSSYNWNYVVMDEGHLIKNPLLKLSENLYQLNATHKLILTGTPIQNSIVELYSLFTFLMPNYLGDYKKFQAEYVKPILQFKNKIKGNMNDENIAGKLFFF